MNRTVETKEILEIFRSNDFFETVWSEKLYVSVLERHEEIILEKQLFHLDFITFDKVSRYELLFSLGIETEMSKLLLDVYFS